MDIIKIIEDLVKIPSVSTDVTQLENAISYCKNYFNNMKGVVIKEEKVNQKPSILLSNADTLSFDVLNVGHIDVVPADSVDMFNPSVKNGNLYGRGTIDMKGGVAVGIKALEYVIKNNLSLKVGILIVSDEEIGGKIAKYWAQEKKLTGKVIIDLDGGSEINHMTRRRKAPYMFDLISKGVSGHGSRPWDFVDANRNLMKTIINLEEYFPYYSIDTGGVRDVWVSTMHCGTIHGGSATNVISSSAKAEMDIRRTEEYSDEKMDEIIKKCIVGNINVDVRIAENVVVTDESSDTFKLYQKILKNIVKQDVMMLDKTGATDIRHFPLKDVVVIQHGLAGSGAHEKEEWLVIESAYQILKLQEEFLSSLIV